MDPSCCNTHGGRAKCGANYDMCAKPNACGNNQDYCCSTNCATLGGLRSCDVASVIGTVRTAQKISDIFGGFDGTLSASSEFGVSIAAMGDMDGDGIPDLAVGSVGKVWLLFLSANNTVKAHQEIISTVSGDSFGYSVCALGDMDNDGVVDLAVGAITADNGGAV